MTGGERYLIILLRKVIKYASGFYLFIRKYIIYFYDSNNKRMIYYELTWEAADKAIPHTFSSPPNNQQSFLEPVLPNC